MQNMNEEKLRGLWGDDLYDYCSAKSVELVGYPDFNVMALVAIGKIKDTVHLTLGAAALGG
jgi:hypothetical protein